MVMHLLGVLEILCQFFNLQHNAVWRIDYDRTIRFQSGQAVTGKYGVLGPLVKQLTEAVLEAELESHLADDVLPNRKNGKTSKTIKMLTRFIRPSKAPGRDTVLETALVLRRLGTDFIRALGYTNPQLRGRIVVWYCRILSDC
jgi:signal recognition particle subunit SEC65